MESRITILNNPYCCQCRRIFDEDIVKLRKIVANDTGKFDKFCRECVSGTGPKVKDVWYGYGSGEHTEENICDPTTGKPIPFSSKQGKWEAMQKAKVREAGDIIHGARTTYQH
jgi:hypothetical protein